MPVSLRLILFLLIGLAAGAAQAADPPARHACLSKAEQRAAVANHRAISLAQAIKAAAKHVHHGDVLRARLCHDGERLVYELTLLARNGKVKRADVDAESGKLIKGR